MSYDAYVNKLNAEHESLVQTIESPVFRRYVRSYLKRVLNEIFYLKRVSGCEEEEFLEEKIAFNEMLIKAMEESLKPNTVF